MANLTVTGLAKALPYSWAEQQKGFPESTTWMLIACHRHRRSRFVSPRYLYAVTDSGYECAIAADVVVEGCDPSTIW